MKVCKRCGTTHPIESFTVGSKRKIIGKCRGCRMELKELWRRNNPEKVKAQLERQVSKANSPEKEEAREAKLIKNTERLLPRYHGNVTPDLRLIQCNKCERILPTMFYSKVITRSLGYNNTCSDCLNSTYGSCKREGTRLDRLAYNKTGLIISNDEKLCRGCGMVRNILEFHKSKRSGDGHTTYCSSCRSVKTLTSAESFKRKAQHAVSVELMMGRIKNPGKCSSCEAITDVLDAHHEDYSKPLDIRWLCKPCHTQYHTKIRFIHMEVGRYIDPTVEHFSELLNAEVYNVTVYHIGPKSVYVLIKVGV